MDKKLNLDEMYPNNIYIKNFDELSSDNWGVSTSLDVFDERHELKRDERARAEYYHWLSEKLSDPTIFEPRYKNILGIQ